MLAKHTIYKPAIATALNYMLFLISILIFITFFISLFHMSILSVCMSVCAPHMCLVSPEARRETRVKDGCALQCGCWEPFNYILLTGTNYLRIKSEKGDVVYLANDWPTT